MADRTPIVTTHVVEAFELFYPPEDFTPPGQRVLQTLAEGVPVEPSIALRLVGRDHDPRDGTTSSYVVHAERTGMFVVVERPPRDPAIVTFLRFYSVRQHELAVRLPGPGPEVTGKGVPWAPALAPVPELHVWGVPVERVKYSGQVRKAFGGAMPLRAVLPRIEAGEVTHTPDGRPLRVLLEDGVPRIVIAAAPPPPAPPKILERLNGLPVGRLEVPPGLSAPERGNLRQAIARSSDWTPEGDGWAVRTPDAVFHLHDLGDGWRVYTAPPAPEAVELAAMARRLRSAGWKVAPPAPGGAA